MKRIVKLTESSINQMVKKILKESYDSETGDEITLSMDK